MHTVCTAAQPLQRSKPLRTSLTGPGTAHDGTLGICGSCGRNCVNLSGAKTSRNKNPAPRSGTMLELSSSSMPPMTIADDSCGCAVTNENTVEPSDCTVWPTVSGALIVATTPAITKSGMTSARHSVCISIQWFQTVDDVVCGKAACCGTFDKVPGIALQHWQRVRYVRCTAASSNHSTTKLASGACCT